MRAVDPVAMDKVGEKIAAVRMMRSAPGVKPVEVKPFDLASIKPPRGEMDGSGKFSPNLYRWLKSRWGGRFGGRGLEQEPHVFRDKDGTLWIGRMDDTGCFIGARLMRVLCKPSQEIYAWTRRSHPGMKLVKNFWRDYRRIGRCAIDKAHDGYWQHDDARWEVKGKTRHCRWCGNHKQRLKVRTETTRVVVKTWVAV